MILVFSGNRPPLGWRPPPPPPGRGGPPFGRPPFPPRGPPPPPRQRQSWDRERDEYEDEDYNDYAENY